MSTPPADPVRTRPDRHRARVGVVLALLLSVVLALGPADVARADQTISVPAGPLTAILTTSDLNCAVNHIEDTAGEFFGDTACATLVAVGGTLFGPANIPAGGAASPRTTYTPVSQTPVTGSGTPGDPYRIVTVVDLGATALRLTQTDTYIAGLESYTTTVSLTNNGPEAVNPIIYRAGDCYLQDSDIGLGRVDGAAVACTSSTTDRIEQWYPLSPGSNFMEASFSQVWAHIGSQAPFPDTCSCEEEIDNGAGLSWSRAIPAGGSTTVSHLTVFSPRGIQPLTLAKTADAATVTQGAETGYTITVSNPNEFAMNLTSIVDTLPDGFAYRPGTSTGLTTADPAVAGQALTWSGTFGVPAATGGTPGTATLHFGVTAAAADGQYLNQVEAVAEFATVVGTGPTAQVTVEGAPPPSSSSSSTSSVPTSSSTSTTSGPGGTVGANRISPIATPISATPRFTG